jgi:hypothetical protein
MPPVVRAETRGDDRRSDHDTSRARTNQRRRRTMTLSETSNGELAHELGERHAVVGSQHLRGLLTNHDRGRVRVAGADVRHDALVGHAQPLDPHHPQPCVDDASDPGRDVSQRFAPSVMILAECLTGGRCPAKTNCRSRWNRANPERHSARDFVTCRSSDDPGTIEMKNGAGDVRDPLSR